MLAHQREHELLLFGEVLFKLRLEPRVEVEQAREHLAVMRVMDDEDLVEQLLRLRHELAARHMVRSLEVIEHLIDREFLERLDVGMYVLLRRLPRRCRIELGEEFLHVESLLADGDLDGIVTAAAVIEMEAIEKADGIGMFLHDIRQRHIFRNHRIASFRGDCFLCLSRGAANCSASREHIQYSGRYRMLL